MFIPTTTMAAELSVDMHSADLTGAERLAQFAGDAVTKRVDLWFTYINKQDTHKHHTPRPQPRTPTFRAASEIQLVMYSDLTETSTP